MRERSLTIDIAFCIKNLIFNSDPEHSIEEEREWIIGESYKNCLLVVVYTMRSETIRIISARPATKSERQQYEEE
ncbi:BrnT family toxin [Cronbergia sp. UHCC 0137]|uniref:BrnT family toxin n=1 Tax=Cronbergia sp. UHCC 0137 TaxID=3110239 RepID=UPI002B207077|nr:BrnT family toxin [Cronbergia sp. UHCC 0137]MEA5616645.1 BrnT family toxin [Cronbergia sp. UHCC 0137]